MGMTRTDTPPSQPSSATQKSLCLSALLQALPCDRKISILDLGPARGINIDFWSQVAGKIHIEDFYESYKSIPKRIPSEDEEQNEEVDQSGIFEQLLIVPPNTRMDVILAWDVFNYLEPCQIEAAARHLGKYCLPGSFLFALIWSTHLMPAEPTAFKILDRERIIYESHSTGTRTCPRYQPRDVGRMMVGFRVFNSFILRNGIQEYLFVYDPPA